MSTWRRRRRPRVLFYVQHLLGTGHIKRIGLIAAALGRHDLDVHVISGGMPEVGMPNGVNLIQLPPLRAKDHSFSALVDEQGNEPDATWKAERCRILLAWFRSLGPDIVVIESFPFGRRKLRFELIPLLEEIQAASHKPLLVCSVRDIVQARPPNRVAEAADLVSGCFDHVMVHGDPGFVDFGMSFPAANRIVDRLHYTGYVAPTRQPHRSTIGKGDILVSGGGGAVAGELLSTAIKARGLSALGSVRWRILAGPNLADNEFCALQAQATGSVRVERNRSDFAVLLDNCRVSVSQCGYNTMIDLIQSRARAIVVPFEGKGETEQALRATALARHGFAEVLMERELSPAAMASAIDRRASMAAPTAPDLDLGGADGAACLLLDAWQGRAGT